MRLHPVDIERHRGALTVGQLIEALRLWPQDARVSGEGCDCANPVIGVTAIEDAPGVVLLEVRST